MIRKAVFLDKDGTLIVDKPYNVNPEHVVLEAGVIEGLLILQKLGYHLIVVSNQPGVALRLFDQDKLEMLITCMKALFKNQGIKLDAFYYCPHLPENSQGYYSCDCRKPQPGLLLRAASEWNIDLHSSWMIGDILNDVEAGNLAGCRSILIDNGNETEWDMSETRVPEFKAQDFLGAAMYISNNQHSR